MNSSTQTLGGVSSSSRSLQLLMAGLLGVFIIGMTGFAPIAAAHNAAHDYRHSMAFPCH